MYNLLAFAEHSYQEGLGVGGVLSMLPNSSVWQDIMGKSAPRTAYIRFSLLVSTRNSSYILPLDASIDLLALFHALVPWRDAHVIRSINTSGPSKQLREVSLDKITEVTG